MKNKSEQFGYLVSIASEQHENGQEESAFVNATRLWNWADCQIDCEKYWSIMIEISPWFFLDLENENSACFAYRSPIYSVPRNMTSAQQFTAGRLYRAGWKICTNRITPAGHFRMWREQRIMPGHCIRTADRLELADISPAGSITVY